MKYNEAKVTKFVDKVKRTEGYKKVKGKLDEWRNKREGKESITITVQDDKIYMEGAKA
jgi:hypothetical protein